MNIEIPLTLLLSYSIYLKHCISPPVKTYKEYIAYFTTKMVLDFYEYVILYVFSISIFSWF